MYCKNLQHNFQCTYPVLFVNLGSHRDPYSIPPYIWEWKPNTLSLEFSLIFLGLVWHPTPELVVPEQSSTDRWLVCNIKKVCWRILHNESQLTYHLVPTQECHWINPNSIVHHSIGFNKQLTTQKQSYKIIWVTCSKLYGGCLNIYRRKDINTYEHMHINIHTHTCGGTPQKTRFSLKKKIYLHFV